MAKRARLDGLPSLAAALLSAELPMVPARAQGTQMSVLPAAGLTNAASVLRRVARAENVAALIAPSDSQAPESVVERRNAAAGPSLAAIGIFSDRTHPPKLAFQAHGFTVLKQGRS